MTKTIHVIVTSQDIAEGKRDSRTRCPCETRTFIDRFDAGLEVKPGVVSLNRL